MAESTMSAQDRLSAVQENIAETAREVGRSPDDIKLIAVSKTFAADAIRPVLEAGQRIFGENRVQEAQGKWPELRADFPDVDLHLIGPLQSNKTKDAVALFDAIHTVDRPKLIRVLAREAQALGHCPALLIQVNTGEEEQKAGVMPADTEALVAQVRAEGLPLQGLMCIPPVEDAPSGHFAFLKRLGDDLGLPWVSMGMSGDFMAAVELGATHVRVGSAIFGQRSALHN